MKRIAFAAALAAGLTLNSPAHSAAYVFEVNYSGGGNAALAAGSDPLLSTAMVAGDSFSYALNAVGDGYWQSHAAAQLSIPFALIVQPGGTRIINYTLTYSNNGTTVLSDAQNGVANSSVHVGANSINMVAGLTFDRIDIDVTILSSTTATTTASTLLPWADQGPEERYPGIISYTASPVPEPAAWALMIAGFGAIGAMLRSRRRGVASAAWA